MVTADAWRLTTTLLYWGMIIKCSIRLMSVFSRKKLIYLKAFMHPCIRNTTKRIRLGFENLQRVEIKFGGCIVEKLACLCRDHAKQQRTIYIHSVFELLFFPEYSTRQ